MIEIRQEEGAVLLPVKVVPGASRTRCLGELDGRLKVAVASPAEAGRANKALIAYLAARLGVRAADICLTSGQTSPLKLLRIGGAEANAVRHALGLE